MAGFLADGDDRLWVEFQKGGRLLPLVGEGVVTHEAEVTSEPALALLALLQILLLQLLLPLARRLGGVAPQAPLGAIASLQRKKIN